MGRCTATLRRGARELFQPLLPWQIASRAVRGREPCPGGAAVAISPADCFVGERRTFSLEGKAPGEVEGEVTLGEVTRTLALTVR